jgi:RNA polymerase sigma-70 factor (ECF subfamily)
METSTTIESIFGIEQDVKFAKLGDKEAFSRLMLKYNDSMYRIATSILNNKQDIEDAYQNTIIKCYKGIANLRSECYFKTWLIRILINECNNIIKTHKRIIPMEEIRNDSVVTHNSYSLELTDAVNHLEDSLRIVTLLFYYEDLSQKDIAKALGIPEGTVSSRLSRARSKLYEILKER